MYIYMYMYQYIVMIMYVMCAVSQTELVRYGRVHSDEEDEFAYNVPSELMGTALARQRTMQSEPVRKTKVHVYTSHMCLPCDIVPCGSKYI